MCATYGLGGGPYPSEDHVEWGLPPLDDRFNHERLAQWMNEQGHTARITGKNKRNLNPLVREANGERSLEFAWWWLHVGGKPAEFSAFNSRDDRLVSRWKAGFQARALLPATWYIEKGVTCGLGGEVFALAAITTQVEQADGTSLTTYSMVTRDAVAAAHSVHPRMPLILPADFHDEWLDTERSGDENLVREALLASDQLSRSVQLENKLQLEHKSGPARHTERLF